MPKSLKKTKSDRINALRKQYDAFLDEDKRRKDRNKFILGRLEKISCCNAVLPVHHMENLQINKTQERPEYDSKLTRFDDNLLSRQRKTDVLPESVTNNEKTILNEITKKYILIPKLRTVENCLISYCNPSNTTNDVDWKNKYSILDELKKAEKEPCEFSKNNSDKILENLSENDNNLYDIHPENIRYPIHNSQTTNEGSDTQVSKLLTTDSILDNSIKDAHSQHKEHLNCNIKENNNDNVDILASSDFVNQEQYVSDLNKYNEAIYIGENVSKAEKINRENSPLNHILPRNIQQTIITKPDDSTPINKNNIVKNLTQEPVTDINTDVSNDQIVNNSLTEKLISNINTKGVVNLKSDEIPAQPRENNESYQSIDQGETFTENIPHQEYEPINETEVITENIISSQIDEFEAEQKEMFYSEESEYNQNVDNADYNAPNEEYTNEQYSYYNQTQQDQPYYAEVNEHEESTERYDPNYEQQYNNNYEENVNVALYGNQEYTESYATENQPNVTSENYEQQPINIDNVHSNISENTDDIHTENVAYESQSGENINYETQQNVNIESSEVKHSTTLHDNSVIENPQEFIQMQTEQDAIQNLEKQLDREEGYIEIEDTVPNEPSIEVDNLSQIQKTDINVT